MYNHVSLFKETPMPNEVKKTCLDYVSPKTT